MERSYAHRTLTQKLGLKENFLVLFINAPENYRKLLQPLPKNIVIDKVPDLQTQYDIIQVFTKSQIDLQEHFTQLKNHIKKTGMLWICWPKAACTIATDLNENIIREIGLTNGLVDVKVISIDKEWSGLKFVYRLKDR